MKLTNKLLQFSLAGLAVATFGHCDRAFALTSNGFAVNNFTLTNTNADGFANATSTSLTLIGGNNSSDSSGTTDWLTTIGINQVGTWQFDWSYFSLDVPGDDRGGYVINGNFTTVATSDGNSLKPVTFNVSNGDVVGFRVATDTNLGEAGEFTINNFEVTLIPFEFSPTLGLVGLGVWGLWNSRKSVKKK
jgi:hypothetical protein